MKKVNLLILAVAILFTSCSSPLDIKFNEETAKDDIVKVTEVIDSTELGYLIGSMFRLKMQKKDMSTMTYGEMIEDGKNWKIEQDKKEAEAKALAEEAARLEAEKIKLLSEAVVVTVFEKGFTEVDYKSYITMTFVIKNKSAKGIRAIKGTVVYSNLFDEEIKGINFMYDQPLAAGETINWEAWAGYNQFKDSDVSLKNKDLKDMKVSWVPEKVIFEDGSTLE